VTIDWEIKDAAESILRGLGLSVSKSFELSCRQVIAHQGLLLDLNIPNETTMKAVRNSKRGKGKRFSKLDDLFEDLGI